MRPGTKKTLVVLGAALGIVVVGGMLLLSAALVWSGVATVSIAERRGVDVTVPLPMAVVEVAVASGDLFFDAASHAGVELELGRWEPLATQLLESLDETPDVVLVEVRDGDDRVRVAKRGRSLLIEVSDSEFDVRISVPTRSVRRTVGRLMS